MNRHHVPFLPVRPSTLARPSRFFFFFNDTATTEIYSLSLHDALPISSQTRERLICLGNSAMTVKNVNLIPCAIGSSTFFANDGDGDRKSTSLNSSHLGI